MKSEVLLQASLDYIIFTLGNLNIRLGRLELLPLGLDGVLMILLYVFGKVTFPSFTIKLVGSPIILNSLCTGSI